MKEKTGITLIALVITIIVLLILAGVTIAMLTGENGILTKANSAQTETVSKGALEKVQIAIAGSFDNSGKTDDTLLKTNLGNIEGIDKTTIPDTITYPFTVKVDGVNIEITKDANGYVKAEIKGETPTPPVGDVPVPNGFYHVGGTKEEGFVISDNSADENKDVNGTLIGNQYVWIPVDKDTFDTKFKRTEGYYNGSLDSKLPDCGEAGADGVNSKVTENDIIQEEAKEMYSSVKTNGGFYIARYEAGKETIDGVDKVVSKKGATVWNNIPWSDSAEMTNMTGGTVEKARGLAAQNGYTSVKSTLCYGVQWDAAMNFIDSNYITNEVDGKPNCDENSYVRNSTGKGNYKEDQNTNSWKGNIAPAGASIDYQVKNIYDMAGNVNEWTMESRYTYYRVYRGGYYDDTGSNGPSSGRSTDYPTSSYSLVGFRSTLYL